MVKIGKLMLCVCVVVVMARVGRATNGMKVIGVGPVQRSMGGAGVALPLDSAATVTNPAGIARLDKRLDIGVTYFAPDVAYTAHSEAGMVVNDDTRITSDTKPCFMPGAGVVVPIDERLTFGVGAYGVCGMGVDYPQNLYYNVTYTKYEFMKVAPALACSVNDRLSIGAALGLNYATMEFNAGPPSEVSHLDGDAFGVGLTVGVLYRLSENVSVGLAYETKQCSSTFAFDTPAGEDRLRLDQPQNLALGLGIHPTPKLRMAFDVVWIDWPQTMGLDKPAYTANSSGAATWNMNWSEQTVYKVGIECDLSKDVTLRAGYNYGKHPLDSQRAFENIAFPAIVEHHLTAGLGIKLNKNRTLNIGVMVAPKVTLATANSAQFIDRATTEMSQYSIDAGLAFRL